MRLIPKSALSFETFAYRETAGNIGSSRVPANVKSMRTVITSDSDEEEIPTPGKRARDDDDGWVKPRNASTISQHQKSINVLKAALERSKTRKVITKKSAGIKRNRDQDSEEGESGSGSDVGSDLDRFDLPDHGRALLKLQRERQKLAQTGRAARLNQREEPKSRTANASGAGIVCYL